MDKKQKRAPLSIQFIWFMAIVAVLLIVYGIGCIITWATDNIIFENTTDALATAAGSKHWLYTGLVLIPIGLIIAGYIHRAPTKVV